MERNITLERTIDAIRKRREDHQGELSLVTKR